VRDQALRPYQQNWGQPDIIYDNIYVSKYDMWRQKATKWEQAITRI